MNILNNIHLGKWGNHHTELRKVSPEARLVKQSAAAYTNASPFAAFLGHHPYPLHHVVTDGNASPNQTYIIDAGKMTFYQDFQVISQVEDFRVDKAQLDFVRDGGLMLPSGEMLVTFPVSREVIDLYLKTVKLLDRGAFRKTRHSDFQTEMGSTDTIRQKNTKKMAKQNGVPFRQSTFFFEGGNCLITHDRAGKPVAVLGEDNVTMTQVHYRHNEIFDMPEYRDKINALKLKLPEPGIAKYSEVSDILIKVYGFKPGRDKSAMRQAVQQFLAEREFIKQEMIPRELGLSKHQCCFIKQPQYHIDMLMTNGTQGRLFLHNYRLGQSFLHFIHENSDTFQLTENQIRQLNRYMLMNSRLVLEQQPLLDEIKQDLIRANLEVVDTPGVFFDKKDIYVLNGSEREPHYHYSDNVNLINGVVGEGKVGTTFYIGPGTNVEGQEIETGMEKMDDHHLSEAFMSGYRQFMTHYVDHVYFVGKSRTDNSFQEAHLLINIKKAGVHCISMEIPDREQSGSGGNDFELLTSN